MNACENLTAKERKISEVHAQKCHQINVIRLGQVPHIDLITLPRSACFSSLSYHFLKTESFSHSTHPSRRPCVKSQTGQKLQDYEKPGIRTSPSLLT